ncbi:ester cyclase [Runella aurantiaca]|uniref:Nuclear transport factor 2 family protein n=1 Tax=Runella aurantiaca TaxID=2282308 RepID=A0A369ID64_9BACT|nr:ester cyclase [Runella aurantiaca]RDB07709.1 nuclear transport factor 2 family protein [Runella aurantiaca]
METTKTTESITDLTRKGTCIEFFSAYQELDTERMISLATPDATVWFEPLGEGGKGLFQEFGKNVWSLLIDCFPDLDNTVDSMYSEDDLIICKVAIFGTQEKDFLGLPSKGLKFNSDHIFVFRFDENDKIIDLKINWNHEGFVAQLTGV